MEQIDVVAVVGTCASERAAFGRRVSIVTDRTLFPASRLAMSPNPVDEAAALIPWTDRDSGAVVELPSDTHMVDFIHAMHRDESRSGLSDIICVVDALHFIDDLRRENYAQREAIAMVNGKTVRAIEYVAYAMLTVTQLEYASKIVLMNWEGVATPNLAALMALVSNLNPAAALWLDEGGIESAHTAPCDGAAPNIQPGWVSVINGTHRPQMVDPRITALHYEQLRPFHPERLNQGVRRRADAGDFGTLVRSAGFCRLATRPSILA